MKFTPATSPSQPPALPPKAGNLKWVIAICGLLTAALWIVFGQTLGFDFVNFDDCVYVYQNKVVMQGLTAQGFTTAFSCANTDNWTPLVTLSHMLDCQLFGLNAGGHHLTNVLLQNIAVIVLFLVLRELTATLWPSAFVAALFAIHPLRVESVAWISERKDVLSGVFFMLTLWAYVRFTRQPRSLPRYLTVTLFFALGLMSKPMLVTLPFVLLLLDYWPLNRFALLNPPGTPGPKLSVTRLFLEKVPLLAMSFAVCIPTLITEHNGIRTEESYRLSLRIANALVSYVTHLERMFYPAHLAAFYPFPSEGLPGWEVTLAALVLVGLSAAAIALRRTHPYVLFGWLWYLGMLVPVIGFIQVGRQAQADRHTYLPQIGLYLLFTWTALEISVRWRRRRWILGGGALVILASLIWCATHLTAVWRNSETVWSRAAACTSRNYLAENNLGNYYYLQKQAEKAVPHYQKACEYSAESFHMIQISTSVVLLNDLAWYLATNPDPACRNGSQAVELAERACELTRRQMPVCLGTLAAAYAETGRFDDAIAAAEQACALAKKENNPTLLQRNQELLKLYQAHQPCREVPASSPPET